MTWIWTLLGTTLALAPPGLVLGIAAAPGLFWFLHSPATVDRAHRYRWIGLGAGAGGVAVLVFLATGGSTSWSWVAGVAGVYAVMLLGFFQFHPSRLFSPLKSTHHRLAAEVAGEIDPHEEVIALVTRRGGPRAYTMRTLIQPHGAWDALDGSARFVTWCSLSGSGAAFQPEVRPNVQADFTSITALEDNIVFYDRRTGNYVQQLGERVIAGPDRGLRLDFVPVWRTTWDVWRRWHPDTRICHQPSNRPLDRWFRSMMLSVHGSLPSRSTPKYPVRSDLDPRLGAMERVLGVEHGGQARAYPLGLFGGDGSVLPLHLGDEPGVILASAEDCLGGAFSRRLGERWLTFEPVSGGAVARDLETGSLWTPSGSALGGPLAGELLTPLRFYWGVFWFRWAITHPDTELMQPVPGSKGAFSAASCPAPGPGPSRPRWGGDPAP